LTYSGLLASLSETAATKGTLFSKPWGSSQTEMHSEVSQHGRG